MGNGNRNETVMGAGGGCGGDAAGGKASSFECDVGLGLKMQNTESYPPCTKKITGIFPSSSYHQKQQYHHPYHETNNNFLSGGSSDYGGYGGCGPQLACVSGVYDAAPAPAVLPRTLLQSSSGGGMTSGKVLFTANQWQELERQTTIYKCMMTSTPVPPELLIPFSSSFTRPTPLAQSNSAGLDLRFSSGSDPEPWRCRRTDGKKWRCSRDVAPDQKYCERHAHKSRPRSRKPVEIQSHATASTTTTTTSTTTGNLKNPSLLSAYNTNQSFQKPMTQFSNMVSATTYDQPQPQPQPRGTEWFMKSGGPTPVSTSTQQFQFQQLMQSSARLGTKRDKNTCVFQQNYEGEQQPIAFNPYLTNGTSDTTGSTTRQHLIDAWSRGGADREGLNGYGNGSNNYKCSLTLSMQSGGNGIDEDNEIFSMGSSSHVGMIDTDRAETGTGTGTGEVLKSQTQWLNSGAWIGSAPGGPLGEALCLGIASNGKGTSTSPHGYSNSTTTSSSCEDGVHGLNFIR